MSFKIVDGKIKRLKQTVMRSYLLFAIKTMLMQMMLILTTLNVQAKLLQESCKQNS